MPLQKISRLLRVLRTMNGLTQAEMAAELDISRTLLSQLENGSDPSMNVLRTISKRFQIPLALLVAQEDEAHSEIMNEARNMLDKILTASILLSDKKVEG
jgi:transcriptional regulator with XRE-family HTH domain